MPMPEQIHWKLYRSKQHFIELERELRQWFESKPLHLIEASESTPERPVRSLTHKEPIPARFGLIAGDYVQNLRSVLDYLVWQLVLANGGVPDKFNAFPVCKTASVFRDSKPKRLRCVPGEAVDLIESLQPFPEHTNGNLWDIEVLDELANENKHRQVLFTALSMIPKPDVAPPIAYMEFEVRATADGKDLIRERLLAFIAFKEGIIPGLEVLSALSVAMEYVGKDVLPLFEKFF